MATNENTSKQDAIADAVITLGAEEGISFVSLRNVAKQAGISMGQVQYYFPTSADMLASAVQLALVQLQNYSATYVMANMGTGSAHELLRAYGEALINEDPHVRRIMRVLAQFESTYDRDTRIGALLARNNPALQEMTAGIIRAGMATGVLQGSIDPVEEARLYWTLVGALSVECAMGASTVERGREVFSYYLNRLMA